MARTKKVGSVGRYGTRIGGKVRRETKKIEDKSRQNKCPACGRKVRRISAGIWECKSCRLKFAGRAYLSATEKAVPMAEEVEVEEKPKVAKIEEVKEGIPEKTAEPSD